VSGRALQRKGAFTEHDYLRYLIVAGIYKSFPLEGLSQFFREIQDGLFGEDLGEACTFFLFLCVDNNYK